MIRNGLAHSQQLYLLQVRQSQFSILMMDVDENQTSPLSVELQTLSTLVEQSPEALASGSQDIQNAAIQAAKHIFDLCMPNSFL